MKTKIIIFFSVLFFVVITNAKSLQFRTNDPSYEKRFLNVGQWNLGFWSGAYFRSFQFEIDKPHVHGDYYWGSVYVGLGFYPVCWTGYYVSDIDLIQNNTIDNDTDLIKFNVTSASSFIASSFLRLEELTPDNDTAENLPLKRIFWSFSRQKSSELTNASLGIYAFVVEGKYSSADIEIQFIVTELAGYLDLSGNVLVVPKAIESIIIISNWNYKSPNNSLSLLIAVGTQTTSWTATGSILAGTGSGKVYYHLASQVNTYGKMEDVILRREINKELEAIFENDDLQRQLTSKYGKHTSVELIRVIFPPGADYIEYDPLMGSGDSPFDPNNDDSTPSQNLGMIIGVTIGALVVVIVIIAVVLFYQKKRAGYLEVSQ